VRPRSEQPIPELIKRDLALGPATVHDLADAIGISVRNLRVYLKDMEGIYIGGWEQRTGPALPVYYLGYKRNKPRPERKYRR